MKKYELFAASAMALCSALPAAAQATMPNRDDAVTTPQTAQQTGAVDSQAADVQNASADDIIVTATKREQTLQDVPISVSVTSNDTIEKAQIVDLIALQTVVPSLRVTQLQSSAQTNFTIRGFGNGNGNIGIESSVGVFVDGVYRSRSASAISDLPELERIEVLRGPQSTLFGKNVSAGAISIITQRPRFDWGMRAEATTGNFGLLEANAAVTGPITESLAFRVYGSVNQRDGYFQNITTGRDVNERNRWSVRGDLLFQPSADFSVRVIADYNRINEICCGVSPIFNGPATQLIGAPRAGVLGVGARIGDTSRVFDRNIVYNTDPRNRLTGKGISAQIDWNVGIARLTSITAYRTQSNDTTLDVDFTGADIANQITADEIKTFTQEFRLTSTSTGPLTWLLGGFYSDEDIRTLRDIRFGTDTRAFIDAVTVQRGANGLPNAAPPVGTLELLQSLVNPAIRPGRTYFQAGQGILDQYTLTNRSYSIFGQAEYELVDGLIFTAGGAYLNDRKKAVSNVILSEPFSSLNLNNVPELGFLPFSIIAPGAPGRIPTNLFAGLNAVQFFYGDTANHGPVNFPNANEDGILKGDKFTYAARLAYDFSNLLNVYVSYSTGWKAGAYNLSSDSRPPNNGVGRTANPEEVTVKEFGAKARFDGGYFNLAVFDQSIKGFQSNLFTGTGFALVNAGKQSVRGFEIDASYRPFRALVVNAAVTYLDPVYDSFLRAPCVIFDLALCAIPAGSPPGTRAPQFRDLSGQRPSGIPEWSGNVSATYTQEFGGGYTGFARGEFVYQSNTPLTDSVPANIASTRIRSVNASIGFSTPDRLDLQFWVRNLTQDNFLLSAFQTVIQSGSYSGYPNEPRTYGVTLRKTF